MTEIRITKEIGIDVGHRVPNHASKCRNPHGHRYRIIAHAVGHIIEDVGAPDEGMLVDFSYLKDLLMRYADEPLDHGFIIYHDDAEMFDALSGGDWKVIVFPYIPTAENIARWLYEQIQPEMVEHFRGNLELAAIEVWETPTSMAIYEGN